MRVWCVCWGFVCRMWKVLIFFSQNATRSTHTYPPSTLWRRIGAPCTPLVYSLCICVPNAAFCSSCPPITGPNTLLFFTHFFVVTHSRFYIRFFLFPPTLLQQASKALFAAEYAAVCCCLSTHILMDTSFLFTTWEACQDKIKLHERCA